VYAAGAVTLALVKRHRTGEGSFVDLAQREAASLLAGEAFVRASLHGETQPAHLGNRSDRWAPQGTYRCAGDDEWVVVSVVTDDEWRVCATSIGRPDLADLSVDERRARHDELDDAIGAWTADRSAQDAMEELQDAGVPAGRVLDVNDVHDDPQLLRRGSGSTCRTPPCTATSRPTCHGASSSATPPSPDTRPSSASTRARSSPMSSA
jgi:crotonobetainyl-CoA:carnitine CoA-transferase CaiB-like acyl-CoA transferase